MSSWLWLGIIILLSILEAATVSLVSIWFIASGLISLILSLLGVNDLICFAVFVILGAALMLFTRKSLVNLLKIKKEETNLERIVGKKGLVTEKITKDKIGEVKIDGKRWSAYSTQDLPEGTYVKVLKIDSVKLFVKKWEE